MNGKIIATAFQLLSGVKKLGKFGTTSNIIKAPKIMEMCKIIPLALKGCMFACSISFGLDL